MLAATAARAWRGRAVHVRSLAGFACPATRPLRASTGGDRDDRTEEQVSTRDYPLRVLLIGAPGSGKGTQSKRIHAEFGLSHIASGDLLRDAIHNGTEIGKAAEATMREGGLVPSALLVDLIQDSLAAASPTGFLLDGFPRTLEQAELLDEMLERAGTPLDVVLNLEVSDRIIMERLAGRLVHPASGRTYHVSFTPPKQAGKDDVTGEPLVRRHDDEPEVIQARLERYSELTKPLLSYYRKKMLLNDIPAPTSDIAHAMIRPLLHSLLEAKAIRAARSSSSSANSSTSTSSTSTSSSSSSSSSSSKVPA